MPSMTRHLGVALLAIAALWTAGRARAICNNTGTNQGCNYDCDCDCGYVCKNVVPKHCVLATTGDPGHCDPQFTSCACRVGFGSTVNQTCNGNTCTPTWAELQDAGDLIILDSGPPPVPDCQFDFDCHCGNHCVIDNTFTGDGGFHCVSWADAGGPTGGTCECASNDPATCVSATCACGDTCACDHMNCDDGGGGTCHPVDAGPPPPNDAGYDCMIDIDCPGGCGAVCSHANPYWLCVAASTGDPGFCNSNLDCNCSDQLCDTSVNSCKTPAVDAGVDAGHDGGQTVMDAGDDAGSTTGGTTGGGSSSCGSSGGGAAGLGVLTLVAAALLLVRRRQFAGGR
jgi:MYXO-CTERM domain-containing protein